jgi:hypothetical protein
MAGDRLFDPSGSLSLRDPLSNAQMKGNIYNTPRYAQIGGLSSAGVRGFMKNSFHIVKPGASTRKVPAS